MMTSNSSSRRPRRRRRQPPPPLQHHTTMAICMLLAAATTNTTAFSPTLQHKRIFLAGRGRFVTLPKQRNGLLERKQHCVLTPAARGGSSSSSSSVTSSDGDHLDLLPLNEWNRDRERLLHADGSSSLFSSPSTSSSSISTSSSSSSSTPTSYPDGDTLTRFKNDVLRILYKLRKEEDDAEAMEPFYRDRVPSYHSIWGDEEWKMHTSRWRYVRYVLQFPSSRLLRRVGPQMAVLLAWTLGAVAMSSKHVLFARLDIGLTSMGLVSTFVAALLTLRSNQGLSRLRDARGAFANVIQHTREMGQLLGVSVYPYDPQMALLASRHVSVFCWLLKNHVRGTASSRHDIIKVLLPNPVDATFITDYQRKPPAAAIVRLRQILEYLIVRDTIGKEVQKQLFQTLSRLNEALTVAERIRNSPMPPIYTAHLTRLLLFYLFWLPISLNDVLGNAVATVVMTLVVGYAMLGLDEISHICELPFKFMPLRQLAKMSMVDSADAITYQPPSLTGNDEQNAADVGGQIGKIGDVAPSATDTPTTRRLWI